MMELKPTITERRRQTRNTMYRLIYEAPHPVSKQQIARAAQYSLPTVHQNIAELLEAGLIRPGEIQKSTGGRPAVGYTINEKIRFSVGIAVSAYHLRILAVDLSQNEIAHKEIRQEMQEGDQGEMIGKMISSELDTFLKENNLEPAKLLGVGITFPGVIDREHDAVVFSPTMNMKDLELGRVREQVPYPVFIENDSTSGGAAEWLGLEPGDREDFVYLFLENGIGGAVFIDGKPYLGRSGRSGEFGHMCIVPGGRKCNCGKRGCLEAYISAFRYTSDLGITRDEFFEGLGAGKKEYEDLWNEVLDYLSIGISNLRLAFDCDIILGGFVSRYLEPWLPALKERIVERSPFESDADFVKLGRYPTKAGMMGVAWHFVQEFIEKI
ncbi:MAG: ROK family transcriptional regulator [Lachnospiraceae bacterium]|nr:ROK family transcriptional regulator [Lachnospiraceae bacterium]